MPRDCSLLSRCRFVSQIRLFSSPKADSACGNVLQGKRAVGDEGWGRGGQSAAAPRTPVTPAVNSELGLSEQMEVSMASVPASAPDQARLPRRPPGGAAAPPRATAVHKRARAVLSWGGPGAQVGGRAPRASRRLVPLRGGCPGPGDRGTGLGLSPSGGSIVLSPPTRALSREGRRERERGVGAAPAGASPPSGSSQVAQRAWR